MAKRFGFRVSAVFAPLALCACGNPSSPNATASESTETRGTIVAQTDPRGDVEGIGPDAEDFYEATPASPRQQHGDIVSTSVGYTATQVLVRIGFADFPPGPRVVGYRVWASFKNKTFGSRSVEVDDYGRVGGQLIRMYLGDPYRRVACEGLDRSIDNGHDAITLSIPRTCLEDPQWIRVNAGSIAWERDGVIETIDDGLKDGYDDMSQELYMFARIPKS